MGLADLAKKNRYQSCKDLVSVLFVFSHYLIMGGFFCITEKTFIPALQATGQCSQNVLPVKCYNKVVTEVANKI